MAPITFQMTESSFFKKTIKTTSFEDVWVQEDNFGDDEMLSSTSDSHPGVILPATITALLLCFALAFLSYEYIQTSSQSTEPQEETILILCTENDAAFEYQMILRVGCPTPTFNSKTFLDVDILSEGDILLGYTIRFSCALLENRFCSELRLNIGSLKPLEISSVALNHGSRRGSIFLFDYILKDLSDDSVIQVVSFNTYLTNRRVIYRGQPWTEGEDDNDDYYPEVPVLELTLAETVHISTFIVLASGCAVVLVERYNLYYGSISREDGSLFRSLMDILYLSPCFLLMLSLIVMSYKYYFKLYEYFHLSTFAQLLIILLYRFRNLLRSEYSLNKKHLNIWKTHLKIFKTILLILSICLAAVTIYFSFLQSLNRSLYWYSTTLVLAVIELGTWTLCNSSNWLISHFDNGTSAKMEEYKNGLSLNKGHSSSNAPKNRYMRKIDAPTGKTIYFSTREKSNKQTNGGNLKSCKSSKGATGGYSGPALFNPKVIGKKKNAKKGGGKLLALKKRKEQLKKFSKGWSTAIKSSKKKKTDRGINKSSKKSKKSKKAFSSKKSKKSNPKSIKTKSKSSKKKPKSKTPTTKSRRSGRSTK